MSTTILTGAASSIISTDPAHGVGASPSAPHETPEQEENEPRGQPPPPRRGRAHLTRPTFLPQKVMPGVRRGLDFDALGAESPTVPPAVTEDMRPADNPTFKPCDVHQADADEQIALPLCCACSLCN